MANFIPIDVDAILQIQRSRGRHNDEIVWDLDKNKVFFLSKVLIFWVLNLLI